jgi:hypothetical protein
MYNKGTAGTRSVVFAFFLNENISKKKSTSMYCYPLKLYSFRSTRINNRSFTLSFRPLSISDKSVDEMFVIILKIISLNLFGCKEVTIVYSDFNNLQR